MMRSLYSAVSGLRNHQTRMDVIGNNISNVNTVGFKSSRVVFQDIYSQTSRAAAASSEDELMGGTNPVQIGLGVTLAAIDVLHTRSAAQRTDRELDLMINGDGFFVVDTNGVEDSVNGGQMFTRAGNLYIDNLGNLVNANGYYVMGYTTDGTDIPDAADDNYETLIAINVEGYENISIDSQGVIRGTPVSGGDEEAFAVIAIATFQNVSGLQKAGNSLYKETANSGDAQYAVAGVGSAGELNVGALEMSNVDLSAEFTDMIVTQRGFQANSRVITVSDTMLEELINLKR